MLRSLFFLLFFLFMLLASREPPWADAHVTYASAESLVERHQLDVRFNAPDYFFSIHNGKRYCATPIGNILALTPSYFAYKLLRNIPALPPQLDRPLFALCSHLSSSLLMAGVCVLFYQLCRRRGSSSALALLMTFGLAFGTICFCYARSPYSEALQTFALLLFVERTFRQGESMTRSGMASLGAAAGLLLNTKLIYVLAFPLCLAYLIEAQRASTPPRWRRFAEDCCFALAAFIPFVILMLVHNQIKTGYYFRSGYNDPAGNMFSGDLLPNIYGFLFSTGKSIFLYSPPLILGIFGLKTSFKERQKETLLLVSISTVILFISAKYHRWHGDYAWGPRYLVPITPLVLLLALPWLPGALARGHRLLRRSALAALFGCGLYVQLIGAALYWDHFIRVVQTVKDQTGAVGWASDHLAHGYFVPQFSPVWGHLWLLRHLVHDDPQLSRDPPWRLLVTKRIELSDAWGRLRLDWWGCDWLKPATSSIGLGVLLFFAVGVLFTAMRLRRHYIRSAALLDRV